MIGERRMDGSVTSSIALSVRRRTRALWTDVHLSLRRPSTEIARRRRRRWLATGAVVCAVLLVVAGVYVVTLPPPLPFHELWSKTLAGNSYGQGVGIGGLFVTYSYTAGALTNLTGSADVQTADLTFQMEGIDLVSGTVLWTSSFVLWGVVDAPPDFLPRMVAAGSDAALAVSWGGTSGANLTVVTVDASTGDRLADWTVAIPGWASTVASQEIATANGTLVTWLPETLTSPTPLLLVGYNVTTGARAWNDSVPIPLTLDGWGLGISSAAQDGSTLEISVTPAGGPAWLLGVAGNAGTVLGERLYNGSADISRGVAGAGNFYFLNSSAGGLLIDGFNLSLGTNLTPIPVDNVRDGSAGSAALFAVDGVLLVASYSNDLSYAAYDPGGRMLWISEFPNATSCGQPDFSALGPCATDLSPPLSLGNGVVLVSSYASLASVGNAYLDTYRAIDVSSGFVDWSANYSLTFGYQFWPWQGPEPLVSVQSTAGPYVLYAVVSPSSISLEGGTT
ncbi:MAG: hypothetical protein L3K00_00665 [Thermoplasmata archaeon]|nr:hypothetical protein [Thermoplasmata archaeon]